MLNNFLFLISTLLVVLFGVFTLKLGKNALIAWIALLGVLANLFVLKQIQLFGLNATASDVYAVGSLLGLNILREQYDLKTCRHAILVSFVCLIFFCLMGQVHLLYVPSAYDSTQLAYQTLLDPNVRIIVASITVFFSVQLFDVYFYSLVLKRFMKALWMRNTISLIVSQLIDTILFSFLGLYGIVDNIGEIIVVSYCIKLLAIFCMVPATSFSKSWFKAVT
ncbi:MAG TPA: queuosine precursor transporter [Gammaproteobacteria bacterium]|nr:queuosine precursor transporter [Gammaproteobacteria bacterium]